MIRGALTVVILLALAVGSGCSARSESGSAPAASSTSSASEPDWQYDEDDSAGEPADTGEADVKKWEKENAVPTSDWYDLVTGREIKLGSLWIYTKLSTTSEAKKVAARMCGTYGQYFLEDEEVTITYVRSKSGERLAKCGPDA